MDTVKCFLELRPKFLIDNIKDDAGLFPIKLNGKTHSYRFCSSVLEINGSSALVSNKVLVLESAITADDLLSHCTRSKTVITSQRVTAKSQVEK